MKNLSTNIDQLPEISLCTNTGAVSIQNCPVVLVSGMELDVVRSQLSRFHYHDIDHKNGYQWLFFKGLSMFGLPCSFSVCFYKGRLTEYSWGVSLPDAPDECGWPTREGIEAEVAFVRGALSKVLLRSFSSGSERFTWGEVWSLFDPNGFRASSGVRYSS